MRHATWKRIRPLSGLLPLAWIVALACGLAPLAPARAQQPAPPPRAISRVALPDSVLDVVTRATPLGHYNFQGVRHILVNFKFAHPKEIADYANAVSDPNSPLYRQFLTPQENADRFGPSQADYDSVVAYLKAAGLTITDIPAHRMAVQVAGTVAQIEAAFGTTLTLYRESELDRFHRAGRNAPALTFFANATPAQLPATIAPLIQEVSGLQNYVRPIPRLVKHKHSNPPFEPVAIRACYDTAPIYSAGYTGAGRTLAVSNFDGFNLTNAGDFCKYVNLPTPLTNGVPTNATIVVVDQSSGTNGGGEGDLDPQMQLGQAPLANIRIYDSGEGNLESVYSKEVSENLADVISESYGWGYSGSSAVTLSGFHTMMVTQGQTYMAASGDNGSNLEGYYYPDIDPEILMVGGTTLTLNGSNLRVSETGWDGSGGGYDTTHTFAKPSYQTGRGVNAQAYRGFPDVASDADPNTGVYFVYGGSLYNVGGTSVAAPTTCGQFGLLEQYLIAKGVLTANSAGKYRLGLVNTALYALNGRNDVFYDVTSGNNGSYSCTAFWDYVTGWGAIDFYNLAAALSAPLAVTVTPHNPTINAGTTLPLTATVTGSNVTTVTWALASGVGSVNASTGLYTAPATVASPMTAVVTATSTINTATPVSGSTTITIDPSVSISGVITLAGSVNSAQPLTFQLQPTGALSSITTMNITLTSTGAGAATGTYAITGLTPGTYNISIVGNRWLKAVVSNVNATSNAPGVNATLLPGDLNADNVIDLKDFSILSSEYGKSGANLAGDLNCDGVVDLKDFNLYSEYYGKSGQSLP